jgi:DNA-binding NtrC family response regulator
MPARVVVVHSDPEFVERATAEIQRAGYEVAAFTDPMLALDSLEAARSVDVLVTDIPFASGKPHGISLAQMTRSKRPSVKVIFTAASEFVEYARGIGEFMPFPVSVPALVEGVGRLLKSDAPTV